MNILFVHLSDLHIRSKEDFILNNVYKLKSAIASQCHNIKKCFILITGDIVYSGRQTEYELALDMIIELQQSLKEEDIDCEIEIIPGNHDCNFENELQDREIILSANLEEYNIGSRVVDSCTAAQVDYFEFYNLLKNSNLKKDVFYKNIYSIGSYEIAFYCFNTAWMSTKKEKPSSLIFPIEYIDDKLKSDHSLVIAMLHHPFNWFTYESSRKIRDCVEKHSDLIFTGHEHDGKTYSIIDEKNNVSDYIEGGALQEGDEGESSFNIVSVDLEKMNYKYIRYKYNLEKYVKIHESEVRNIRISNIKNDKFKNISEEFQTFLSDAGAYYINKEKSKVYLDDIYIYPDLKENMIKEEKREYNIIKGKYILENILKEKKVFIYGTDTIGKTALCKILFKDFIDRGYIPLFLNGKDLRLNNLDTAIYDNYIYEYDKETLEDYKQESKTKKILLIDDLQKCCLNLKGKNQIVNLLDSYFEIIIIMASEELHFEVISECTEHNKTLFNMKNWELLEFRNLLRYKLIKKWYGIGNEFYIDETDLEKKINKAEKNINVMLCKNLLPSIPLYILTLLPLFEDISNTSTHNKIGSYGYLYDSLITNNINAINSNISIDTKYTYLSILAYYKFTEGLQVLGEEDLENAHKVYEDMYGKKINKEKIINELLQVNIIEKRETIYNFKYKYLYYYFIAKYISDNIEDDCIKKNIKEMTDKLYDELNANVILFLCHLSKNSFIIENVLNNAREIFKDITPCDMDNNVVFLNNLYNKIPEIQLHLGNPNNNKENFLEYEDKLEIEKEEEKPECNSNNSIAELEVASTLNKDNNYELDDNTYETSYEMLMLNKSLKTLKILGLIVKNFEGSLKSDTKYDLTEECYFLAMRTLNLFIKKCEKDLRNWISILGELFEKEVNNEDDIKQLICIICELISITFINRVSSNIGLEELNEIYKKILDNHDKVSFKLIDINIKMDNYSKFPISDIIKINKELRKNTFASLLLKHSVVRYFYLNRCDYKVRQLVCDNLKIKLDMTKVLSDKNKND